jgi:hypothetical protein
LRKRSLSEVRRAKSQLRSTVPSFTPYRGMLTFWRRIPRERTEIGMQREILIK